MRLQKAQHMGAAGWFVVVVAAVLVVVAFAAPYVFSNKGPARDRDPWARVPPPLPGTDHAPLIDGPLETGPDATRACLECHADASRDVMKTAHWTWEGHEVVIPGRLEPVRIGKKNTLNNYS